MPTELGFGFDVWTRLGPGSYDASRLDLRQAKDLSLNDVDWFQYSRRTASQPLVPRPGCGLVPPSLYLRTIQK